MHIWEELNKPRHFHWPDSHTVHEFVHRADHWVHRSYLFLVSIEVKYWYGKAALVLLVIEIISIFVHEEVE